MSRGGHNWRGGGTVEGSRFLDVMMLARAGHLSDGSLGSWRWTYRDGTTASIDFQGGRREIILDYRIRLYSEDWQSVRQRVPIRWTPCRFGGERPWFVCDVHANGVYCGRRVAKLYGGSAIEFWPSSADGFWPTPGPSTYGRPSRSGGLAWTGEPKWICSSSFVESMNLVLGR